VSRPIPFPEVSRERLPNGATLLAARRPGVPLVAVRLIVEAGGALDPAGRHGLAHLVTAVARRGTRRRTGRQLDLAVEQAGAEMGAGSDEDGSYYGLSAPVEHLPRLLDLVAEVATEPAFPAPEFARLRRRELAGVANLVDEPAALADRTLLRAAYGDHPYGHPADGRLAHLRRTERRDALGFHRRWYGPASAMVVVVGDVAPERALALAGKRLSRWRAAAEERAPLPAPRPAPRAVFVVDKPDLTQTQIRIGLPAMARRDPAYFAASVANATFGGGFTSRLVDEIRVNRGLSYGVRSRYDMSREAGIFVISSFTKNETAAELVEVALEQARRYADEGPSAAELERAQGWLAGLFPLGLETHEQVAERIADLELYGYARAEVVEYRERVRAVTTEDCRRVARATFPLAEGAIVAVGPAKVLERSLARFGPVTVIPARRAL